MKTVLYFGFLMCLLLGAAVLYELSLQPVVPVVEEVVDVTPPEEVVPVVATTTPTSEEPTAASSTVTVPEALYAVLGEPYEADGLSITLSDVIEDSRCPSDVTCIQAGTVRVRGEFSDASGTSERTLVLNESTMILGRTVRLSEVLPRTVSTKVISPASYQFFIEVE